MEGVGLVMHSPMTPQRKHLRDETWEERALRICEEQGWGMHLEYPVWNKITRSLPKHSPLHKSMSIASFQLKDDVYEYSPLEVLK